MDGTTPLPSGIANEATNIAQAIERGGIIAVLVMAIILFLWLYLREQKKNEELHSQISANGREMTSAIVSMDKGVAAFTKAMDVVGSKIEDLENAVKAIKP